MIYYIQEGFFGQNNRANGTQALTNGLFAQSLANALKQGSSISEDGWDYINANMDACIEAKDNDDLRKLCANAISAYGLNVSLNWIGTSNVDNMDDLFCNHLYFNGDVSRWDVSNVTSMASMFQECHVFNCDISGWDVSNVCDFGYMFEDCYDFQPNLSSWNTVSAQFTGNMFANCNHFNCDLSRWDMSGVETMSGMFYCCYAFESDLSEWDVCSVTLMDDMFFLCKSFDSDLSGWDVSFVDSAHNFAKHSNLAKKHFPKFNSDIM